MFRSIPSRRVLSRSLLAAIAALSLVGTATLDASDGASGSAQAVTGRQLSPPYYVFTADVPHDIVTQDVGAIGFQPFVDILGWDSFLALNWPVPDPIVERGVPDRQNLIGGLYESGGEGGGPSSLPTGPTVWETWKDSDDIYLNPPVKPTPFDAPESIPAACKDLAAAHPQAARRTLTMEAKVSDVLRNNVQAFTLAPLIDQNGEKVWYEVKVNRAYYDYVVNNGFYDSRNQVGKTIDFPASSNTTLEEPAMKVKAAWKIMGLLGSRQPDDPTKFYTTWALILDPDTGVCRKELVGLVGLHVVQKTKLLPQWSWATFEQVDNAPDQQNGPVPGKKYNFFSASCAGCPFNQPPSKTNPNFPTQVVRLVPVDSEAPNATYQAALKTLRSDNVWANYMLVNSQWAGTRTPLGVPSQPKYLANTTMETYLQQPVDDPAAPHGCINCHGTFAGSKDLDFQLFKAYPQDGALEGLMKAVAAAAAKEKE
ncbi:MAG: hypothetical protein KDD47_20380 [Acidobacteria bacterium]|nr:hypothetical protein [Acidobacteriota bacterium]